MISSLGLLRTRRFLPIFCTQFLGAFNDNLFKNAMVLFAVYAIFHDERAESSFTALVSGVFILPFFFLSALAGQMADSGDKARIVRVVKWVEVAVMVVGGAGLMLAPVTASPTLPLALMLVAVAGLGVHSTFFGPIKYAILPQHLAEDDVLGGTGLVEAGTYLAILLGTIIAGVIYQHTAVVAAFALAVAVAGLLTARTIPPAPRMGPRLVLDWNPFRASWRLIRDTMHIPRLFLSICAISFFWTIGAVLVIVFPPLVKNVLTADAYVASLTLAVFSVGVAIGSLAVNLLLKGAISARYAPASVIAMGLAVLAFWGVVRLWTPAPAGRLYTVATFLHNPRAALAMLTLALVAVFGGMFVVPLYAFLTTTVAKEEAARTVAANNIVNAGAMTLGSLAVAGLAAAGMSTTQMLLMVAAMCLFAAWLAQKLHRACDHPLPARAA